MFSRLKGLLPVLVLLVLVGCAGPLEVKYNPRTPGQFRSAEPAAVFVAPFDDKREIAPGTDPRTVGAIKSTVSDMTGDNLTLSENITDIVGRAWAKELALAGFTVVDEKDRAVYALSGEVREFSLEVGSRDSIALEIYSTLVEAKTGRVLWSGAEAERSERFAGVMGNSRATLSDYIAASLQKLIRRSISSAGGKLAAAPVQAGPQATAPVAGSLGRMAVSAAPERSKVYIDGVYYGLSPLSVDLAPGVYEVEIRHKGFRSVTEKVSVRDGATTEMETGLEKE